MKQNFCKSCGTTLQADEGFCPECGTAIIVADPSPPSGNVPSRTKMVVKKEPFSRKKKVLFSILAMLAVIVIGGHLFLMHLTDSTKQLQAIHNAIVDENGEALSKELTFSDETIYDKMSFVKSLKNNDFKALIDDLSSSMDTVKETGLTAIIVDQDGIELFRMNREKLLFFYSNIIIEPVTYSILVNTEILDSTLEIAGTEFKLDGKSITIDKVVPTDYEMVLSGKNPYFESTGKIFIDKPAFANPVEIDLPASEYSVSFADAPADSILFINDVSTEKLVKDIAQISPVFANGATFHAVRKLEDGKSEKSEEIVDAFGKTISFKFPLLAKAEEDAEKKAVAEAEKIEVSAQQAEINEEKVRAASYVYETFRNVYEEALNYKDFSSIEYYLYGSGTAYEEMKDFIKGIDGSYYSYNFITNEVKNGEVIDDSVHLNVFEVFDFENEDGDITRYERAKEYVFIEVSPEHYEISKINIKDTKKN